MVHLPFICNPCVQTDRRDGSLYVRVRVPWYHPTTRVVKGVNKSTSHSITLTEEVDADARIRFVTIRQHRRDVAWSRSEDDVDHVYDAVRRLANIDNKGWALNSVRRLYLQRLDGEEGCRFVRYLKPEPRRDAYQLVWAEDATAGGFEKHNNLFECPSDGRSSQAGDYDNNQPEDPVAGLVGALSKTSLASQEFDPVFDAVEDALEAAKAQRECFRYKIEIRFGKVMHLGYGTLTHSSQVEVDVAMKRAEGQNGRLTAFSNAKNKVEFQKFERVVRSLGGILRTEKEIINVQVVDLRRHNFRKVTLRLDPDNDMEVIKAVENRGKFFVADLFNCSTHRPDTRLALTEHILLVPDELDVDMVRAAQAVARSDNDALNPDPSYRFACFKSTLRRRVYYVDETSVLYTLTTYTSNDRLMDLHGGLDGYGVEVHNDELYYTRGADNVATARTAMTELLKAAMELARRYGKA